MRVGAVLVEVPTTQTEAYGGVLAGTFRVTRAFVDARSDALRGTVDLIEIGVGWWRTLDRLAGAHRHAGGDAPCVIRLSSGSTGTPTGQPFTHDELARLYRADSGFVAMGIVTADRPRPMLIALSISFAGLFGATLTAVLAGSPVVLLPKFAVASDMVRAIDSWGAAILPARPDMSRTLVVQAPSAGLLLPDLHALVSMGQPLFAADKHAVIDRVTHNLYDTYGAAGIGLVAYLSPPEMRDQGHTVGRPIAGIEVEIVDGHRRPLPPGATGRLRVRRAVPRPIADGDAAAHWVDTNDIARVGDDGYIELVGRAADMVTRHGVEIFPPAIEEVLLAHPAVREAAVTGRPIEGGGQELVAFIVKGAPLAHDDLVQHCTASLPRERLPDRIFYTDVLPRLGTGKLDRARLRRFAAPGETLRCQTIRPGGCPPWLPGAVHPATEAEA
jgi:acyl-coenzyme A synthetase/AMP-(fatty) acid ligase